MKRFCIQLKNKDAAIFSVLNQSFLYSTNTLAYFPLTDCARDILLCDSLLSKKYSSYEIQATKEKLKDFYADGIISKIALHEKSEIYYGDYYLKLVLSTKCNLCCSYCFARKSSEFDMSFETAKKAILFFVEKFVPDKNCRIVIDLSGSGEPLLNFELILKINQFVLTLKEKLKINVFCQFASNGMLLDSKTSSLLKKNGILFGVSLDGNKIETEKYRAGLDYEKVCENIRKIENKDFFGIGATYSAENHDFVQIFKTLCSFNPEVVGMKPVRLNVKNPNAINENSIEKIKDSYDIFAKWIYKQLCFGNKRYFYTFYKSEDFFVRFLKATLKPLRLFYRCSAGINSFAVDSKENILVCPAFIGNNNAIIGNLDCGIFPANKESFRKFLCRQNRFAQKLLGALRLRRRMFRRVLRKL